MPGRDPTHWLHRLTADEWLRAGMRELSIARATYARHATRPALASARRAAGMAWNAVLALAPDDATDTRYGRSYADHLRAIAAAPADDATVDDTPSQVREAARRLMEEPEPRPGPIVQLARPTKESAVVEAAETILAEAYARVVRAGGMKE